ncbi:Methionyl-tRNA synthetase [hydrothermal vent metagenome]|uniref:Methionine--tRNA ligase n=1 Tax=hydrothermal vent metagenome TaxID=652676 RepID=A0A3B1BTU9_9ZZZZ
MPPKTMIVTAALPYANGSIHLGHLVEYIQTDIFVRFQKMRGQNCLFFCADDTHGAPIMIRAKGEGTTPEKIIERYHQEHQRDFDDFHIKFDNYHSTNSEENRLLSEEIFLKLKKAGHITTKDVEQAYCEHDKMFLPDRFVRGVCPKCGAEDQYGDVCEACGSHYSSTELKNPRCSICGAKPVRKVSGHYFFHVSAFEKTLKKFVGGDALQPEVKNFLATWMKEGLRDWDISRDGPYFGFKIPGEESKYFYVWLDAPVGYIASAKNWADQKPEERDFEDLWRSGGAEIHHFIGKDIVYFHTLFWIPMLEGSGFKLPGKIHVHGFLTVNGEKMSKTKGTFINARAYLDHLDPEYLRYYYASKLKNSVDDLDLSFSDFVFRVNAELVNKVANLGSRVISILNKNKELENRIEEVHESGRQMIIDMHKAADGIAADYDACDFNLAIKKIMRLTDAANTYIDQAKPWELKNDPQKLQEVLSAGINAFRLITVYLKPVVPRFAEKVENILKIDPLTWDDSQEWMTHHTIGQFERLAERIDIKSTEKIVEVTRKQAGVKEKTRSKEDSDLIEFEDFTKIKLRTAKVIEASKVEKADKLLKLTVDLGDERRTLVAGIAKNYEPDEMIGKTVVIVSNLKPRKIMGIESNGMALAVNDGDTLKLIAPDGDVAPGLKVS